MFFKILVLMGLTFNGCLGFPTFDSISEDFRINSNEVSNIIFRLVILSSRMKQFKNYIKNRLTYSENS